MSAFPRKASIAEFFASERDRLVRYVRRLIDDNAERDGEDIVQDVALSLLSRTDVLVPIESLSAYVYQSLRHRVIDHLRSRKYSVPYDESDEEEGGPSLAYLLQEGDLDFEREVTRAELRRNIFEAIDDLPEDQKAVVLETEMNGRTFRELSAEWGIPIGTLLARKSRALAKVRESLMEFKP
jgi:RNA polymerase sigma factor (sigma-70 family)